MSYLILNEIVNAFGKVYGGSLLFLVVIFGFFLLLLLMLDVPRTVIVMILIPLSLTIVGAGIKSIYFHGLDLNIFWIPVSLIMVAGLILASVFWKIMN